MYPLNDTVLNLYKSEQRQVLRITGTDSNNTAISITDADIVIGGFNVDRFSITGETFEIGTACAAELTLKLNNSDGRFDDIIFGGTELYVEIGIANWSNNNPTIYYMPVGYFTSDEQPRKSTQISIKALDRMTRFDKVVDIEWFESEYTTHGNLGLGSFVDIAQDICEVCNMSLNISGESLINTNLGISSLPRLSQQYTYRDLIRWISGMFARNAYIAWDGTLRFAEYKLPYLPKYYISRAERFNSTIDENAITITGVTFKFVTGDTITYGEPGYIIDYSNNYMMARMTQYGRNTSTENIANKLIGFSYKPFSATVINAPYLYPMDVVRFYNSDNSSYDTCIITNVNFGINGTTELAGKGQTKTLNNQANTSSMTDSQSYVLETMAVNSQIILASGTKSFGTLPVGAANTDTISFASELSTSNYIVVLQPVTGNITAGAQQKTTTGFTMYVRNVSNADATGTVAWAIIKLP